MPVKTKTESWVQTFREQLKSFMAPKAAWYVQESRGKIRLLVKEDGKTQTLTLEHDWSLKGATESIKRISSPFLPVKVITESLLGTLLP